MYNRFQSPFFRKTTENFKKMNQVITYEELLTLTRMTTKTLKYIDNELLSRMVWDLFNHQKILYVDFERWKSEFYGNYIMIILDLMRQINEEMRDIEDLYIFDIEEKIVRDIALKTKQDVDDTENTNTNNLTVNKRLFDEIEKMKQVIDNVNNTKTNTIQNTVDSFFQNPQTGGQSSNFETTRNTGNATTNSNQDFTGKQTTDRTNQTNNTTDFNETFTGHVKRQQDKATDFKSDELKNQKLIRDRGDIQNRVATILEAYNGRYFSQIKYTLQPLFLSIQVDSHYQ